MNLGPLPNRTLDEYCREGASLVDVRFYDAMAIDDENLVIYDHDRFDCDTVLGAWKRCWAVLSRWSLGILVDTRFADMPFVRCVQELSYCRRLRALLMQAWRYLRAIRKCNVGSSIVRTCTCTLCLMGYIGRGH